MAPVWGEPLFLYDLAQVVRWAALSTTRYVIDQRRWTQRRFFGPVVEYLLCVDGTSGGVGVWAYEADLEAWETEG